MHRASPAPAPPRWVTPIGIATFVALMSAGYAYNVTFVQLGVTDLGRRLLGLSDARVAGGMALLAVVTAIVAVGVGSWMGRAGVGRDLRRKFRIAAVVVACQTLLTFVAPHLPSPEAYTAWLIATAVALGVGVPVTFSLTVDLVPVRRRGLAAGAVTAVAYAFAPLASGDWTIEPLVAMFGVAMIGGTLLLVALGWLELGWVGHLGRQHARPSFGRGRYVRADDAGRLRLRRRLLGALVLLFVVFFVDSLGFLRLVDTPFYVAETWRSDDVGPRLAIAVAHVAAAAIGGVLYGALGERALLAWVLGAFVLVHLGYQIDARLGFGDGGTLGIPVLYAIAVSLYTVVAFAIWADLSTPDTIGLHAALGVAASAWTATFLATALALRWAAAGVAFERHVALVNAVTIPAFLILLLVIVWPRPSGASA
jgi:MFS family permease